MWAVARRAFAAAAGGLAVLALAGGATDARAAYQEFHAAGDDVRLAIDGAGVATIEHAIRYRVVAGTLREIELIGIEANAVLDPVSSVTTDDGRELPIDVSAPADRTVRLTLADPVDPVTGAPSEGSAAAPKPEKPRRGGAHAAPKGLRRGLYTFHLRYRVDLVQASELVRDGAMWRLTWTSPPALEGYDAAKVILALPPAPTEPRAVKPVEGGIEREDGILATVRRAPDQDELELVRPRVARGELATWVARIDPRALSMLQARMGEAKGDAHPDAARAGAITPGTAEGPNRFAAISLALGIGLAGLLFGVAVRAKHRAFDAAARTVGLLSRPLVAFPRFKALGGPRGAALRAVLAGLAFAAAIALEVRGALFAAASLLVAAMALGVLRAPRTSSPGARPPARGPGAWRVVAPDETPARPSATSGATIAGMPARFWAAGAPAFVVLVAALVLFARHWGPLAPYLVVLDALVVIPLLATGRPDQLPPGPARAWPRLRRLHDLLGRESTLRVATWARFPPRAARPDELRLLILPRAPMPGLVAIEVGLAWARGVEEFVGGWEVLVRMHEDSPAAERAATFLAGRPLVPGRRAEERVVQVVPRGAGLAAVRALAVRLAREFGERRAPVGDDGQVPAAAVSDGKECGKKGRSAASRPARERRRGWPGAAPAGRTGPGRRGPLSAEPGPAAV
jgi:hypothetical protein